MGNKTYDYWDLDKLKMANKVVEDLIFACNSFKKTKIDLHEHSCMSKKYPKLEVGKVYFIDNPKFLFSQSDYKKCVITLIRSGVVFYKEEGSDLEKTFEETSLVHLFAEPEEISVNLDPERYEIISYSGKMKVNYIQ